MMKSLLERYMNQSLAEPNPGPLGLQDNQRLQLHSGVMSTSREDGRCFREGRKLFRRRVETGAYSVASWLLVGPDSPA